MILGEKLWPKTFEHSTSCTIWS